MRPRSWILVILISLILIQTYCTTQVSPIKAATQNDWVYRYDLNHSGYTIGNGTTNSAQFLWSYPTGSTILSSPAVYGDTVIVGGRDGLIYWIDTSTGENLYNFSTNSMIEWCSPSIIDGRVYIGAINGHIYCLNVTTGNLIWETITTGLVRSSPLIVGNRVYVGSNDNNLYCLDAIDGRQIWNFTTGAGVDSAPAYENGVIYFGSNDYNVYALNASTGKEIWRHFTVNGLSAPTVYKGYVYIGSKNGTFYCLDAVNGNIVWRYYTFDWISSSPSVAYGCVYFGSEDNSVYCLNATTGQKIWQTETGYWVWSSPTVCDGNLYVGSDDRNIYCLDAFTGALKWSWATRGAVNSSPAIANNTLYVGSDDFCLYAFKLCNATTEAPAPHAYSPKTQATMLFDIGSIIIFAVIVLAFALFFKSKFKQKAVTDAQAPKLAWHKAHIDAIIILATLGFASLFFINLGNSPLWAADEQTYTQWAYHMIKTGDYLTPWSFGGLSIWIGKPPLNMWLISLGYQIFGVNNFAARFFTVIFSMLSLVTLYFLGKKLYNRYVGALSVLVLSTFYNYIEFSRRAMIDIELIFFMLASIYIFILSQKAEENQNRLLILSGLMFGLALLAKQVEALLIPFILLSYLIISERKIKFGFKSLLVFVGIGALMFVPWLILMNNAFGYQFWVWSFLYSGYVRTVSPIEGHVGDPMFYLSYLFYNENLLWVLLLPIATALSAFKGLIKRVKGDVLVISWMFIVLLVFTVAQTKIPWYILPAYPAFAIAVSSFIFFVSEKVWKIYLRLRQANSSEVGKVTGPLECA